MRRFLVFLVFCSCAEAERHTETEGRPIERAVVLADGSTVISRPGDAPGETELYRDPPGTILFPGPGGDDLPTVLLDGRLLFVSTRSTIASLWIGDVSTGELVQLTNRGLSAGKPRVGFVPPPHGEITVERDYVEYDSGYGEHIRVALASGDKEVRR